MNECILGLQPGDHTNEVWVRILSLQRIWTQRTELTAKHYFSSGFISWHVKEAAGLETVIPLPQWLLRSHPQLDPSFLRIQTCFSVTHFEEINGDSVQNGISLGQNTKAHSEWNFTLQTSSEQQTPQFKFIPKRAASHKLVMLLLTCKTTHQFPKHKVSCMWQECPRGLRNPGFGTSN